MITTNSCNRHIVSCRTPSVLVLNATCCDLLNKFETRNPYCRLPCKIIVRQNSVRLIMLLFLLQGLLPGLSIPFVNFINCTIQKLVLEPKTSSSLTKLRGIFHWKFENSHNYTSNFHRPANFHSCILFSSC